MWGVAVAPCSGHVAFCVGSVTLALKSPLPGILQAACPLPPLLSLRNCCKGVLLRVLGERGGRILGCGWIWAQFVFFFSGGKGPAIVVGALSSFPYLPSSPGHRPASAGPVLPDESL